AEPLISRAIDYESARDAAQDALDKAAGLPVAAGDPDVFSRGVQMNVGMGAGLVLFGAAMGALVAVAYCVAVGRIRLGSFKLALLVPVFFFVGMYAVPFAKYPANPPAIGHPDTIRMRGALYLVTVFVSCLALFLAVYVGQRLHRRLSLYWTVIVMGVAYAVVMGVLFVVLPPVGHLHANLAEYGRQTTETPLPLRSPDGRIVFPGFPADLLAQFRAYSIAAQVILWGAIAVVFAPLAERVVEPEQASRRRTERAAAVPSIS
ncbi:MAG: CbtA family protein, partial [Nocardioides sp.]|nr:CbtA family protein [Nocardioides sp.]